MTEYTKETYLAACAALWDKKPTEVFIGGHWFMWGNDFVPSKAGYYQWRAADPTREYREAFKAGKRVECKLPKNTSWIPCNGDCAWSSLYEYRIVEPKKVKLLPFAIKYKDIPKKWYGVHYHESLEDAIACHYDCHVAPISPDGSIEVDV